jgi:hypothetical protein
MKPTNKNSKNGTIAEPIMSSEELYDLLMQEIEPDLALGRINSLDEIYKDENSDEHADRMAHYEFAFFIFDQCLTDIEVENETDLRMFKDAMKAIAEEKNQQEESKSTKNIEDSLNDA